MPVPLEGRAHRLLQVVLSQSRHPKGARARADGDGKPPLRAGNKEEQGPRRRFLERLQECVRRILVELICPVDDDDTPAPLARRMPEKGAQAPDLLDADPLRIAL